MENLGTLKERKNKLLFKKEYLKNKKPSKFLKVLYCLGVIIIGIFSSVVFWDKTPSLVFCLTYLYSVSVPVSYERRKEFEIGKIEHELFDIQRRIDSYDSINVIRKITESNYDLQKEFDSIKMKNDYLLNDTYEEVFEEVEERVEEGPKLRLKM